MAGNGTRWGTRMRRVVVFAATIACCSATLAAVGVAIAAGGKPVKGATYKGTNSEGGEVSFTVSKNGKDLLDLETSIGYNGECGQGGGPSFEVDVKSLKTSKGKFSTTTKGIFDASSLEIEPIKLKLSGTISGSKAKGKLAEIGRKCSNTGKDPYSETFTATAS